MTRYIILDRDGVINHDSDSFIKSADEWQAIDGSLEAIALLNQHNYKVVVITNQSGIARRLFTLETLQAIHDKMQSEVDKAGGKITAIYYCPHGPDDQCQCRKPKPGLFKQFAREHGIDLPGIPVIGDSMRDLQAASAVNAKPILVRTGKGERIVRQLRTTNIPVYENLYEASIAIIKSTHFH
ncbi:MAG TPA: D-glycero-beta-D-manno-heptose 1,7-bisphosphate 7-phosphatase [Crenotrichaceae bacterium]|nr:D-glycero-beta-D-manno-heptose 1,7-bisphosphate 7-phosphatase [Crenotrichaceae bacterium]